MLEIVLPMVGSIVLCIATAWVVLTVWLSGRDPEVTWDWSRIDLDEARFPPDFLWGVATAAHQVEGGMTASNWTWWEEQQDEQGRPRVEGGQKAGAACEHWERYREDILLMRDSLGVKSYRFSIEWSRIEPEPSRFDQAAIDHYHDVIDALLEAGIEPMITLHHFTHPLWFEQAGGFEKAENIDHVVRFSERAFAEYGARVKWWCTFNEPGVFATMGYGLGIFPPGRKSAAAVAVVLRNLMVAHLRIYEAIKAMPGGQVAQVGLVKNIFQFDPWHRWNLVHLLACKVFDEVYNEAILRFLRDGVFAVRVPGLVSVRELHPRAKGATDFIGLNYYSNLLVDPFMKRERPFVPRSRPGQVLTDMPYTIYAEGFWRALKRIGTVGRPVIVTENGIADEKDDRRALWIRRYAWAMHKAMNDGVDVRGLYYWSLLDNFEWAEGYGMRFGLFEVDYATQERRLREGSRAYVELIRHG